MKRILLRSPNWIGDQVLAYPFYKKLRDLYPSAWIAAICTDWVRDIQFKGLVDEVFVLPKKRGDSLFQVYLKLHEFSKTLKQSGPWDFGIALPNSFGAALVLYLAGVKERRGYATDARNFLLTQKINWIPNAAIHRSQAYLDLLAPEGPFPFEAKNYWRQSNEKQFDANAYWPGNKPTDTPIEPPNEPYFLIAPGATADSRRWSTDQFVELIEKIQQRWDYPGLIIGGQAEREIAIQFLKRGLKIEDYTGKGWVSAHWKLFRNAAFTVCNESGLAHVASLCGSKVHIICGAADPERTKPIGPGLVQVSTNPVECWPCERNTCQFEDARRNQCLKGIYPDRVIKEIESGFFAK